MKAPADFRIELARPEHLREIAALAEASKLDRLPEELAVERGFLVSAFGEDDYRDFLTRANHFYVLVDLETVVGFMLAYSSDRIRPNEWLNSRLKLLYPDPFILIKQICIRADLVSRGLATRLYEYLFSQAQELPLFGAIVLEPSNPRSVKFHEKLGFEKVLEIRPPDGLLRGVWRRERVVG